MVTFCVDCCRLDVNVASDGVQPVKRVWRAVDWAEAACVRVVGGLVNDGGE